MSQTAERPWWADVQHLRPAEHAGTDEHPARTGRFDRPTAPTRRPAGDHRPTRVAARAAHRERPEPADWLEEAAPPAAETWPEEPPAAPAPKAKPERRTIEIRGQVDRVHGVAPVPSAGPQRHGGRRASERVGRRPDRVAMWAVLLGLLLILVALLSSPGADAAVLLAGWV